MKGRRRIEGRTEWPEGLYKRKMRGVERFYFVDEKGKDTYFPVETTFIEAYGAAQQYNNEYRNPANILATKLDKFNRPLREWSPVVIARVESEEEWGDNAINTFVKDVERLNDLFGDVLSKELDQKHATDYLNHYCVEPGKSKNVYNRKLTFLNQFFGYLNDEGGLAVHPSAGKKKKKVKRAEKKKARLDLDKEAYLAIYEAAPLFLKVAMSICLQSTHAVKELHRLKLRMRKAKEGECGCVWFKEAQQQFDPHNKEHVTVHGTLYIHRHKSQHKKTSFVAIPITNELKAAIDLAKTDRLVCPYVVRRKPDRFNKIAKDCDHRFQVTSNHISREFSKVRDELGLYEEIDKDKRPTFHEIRRVAAREIMGDGVNPMERMAHADEASTKVYTDNNNIEWNEVAPIAVHL